MHIKVLGAHQYETRTNRDVSLLVDGVLAVDAGSLTSSLTLPQQARVRNILITHRHYDHVRDLGHIGWQLLGTSYIDVFSIEEVIKAIHPLHISSKASPPEPGEEYLVRNGVLRFHALEVNRALPVDDYEVLALPVNHNVPTVGYQVMDKGGKGFFYTGDTGVGCSSCWEYIRPDLIFIESTYPNRMEDYASEVKHLTPRLLQKEIEKLRQVQGYLPRIAAIHLNSLFEEEVRQDLKKAGQSLGQEIIVAYEDMEITL